MKKISAAMDLFYSSHNFQDAMMDKISPSLKKISATMDLFCPSHNFQGAMMHKIGILLNFFELLVTDVDLREAVKSQFFYKNK
jgi:hypothetical protein